MLFSKCVHNRNNCIIRYPKYVLVPEGEILFSSDSLCKEIKNQGQAQGSTPWSWEWFRVLPQFSRAYAWTLAYQLKDSLPIHKPTQLHITLIPIYFLLSEEAVKRKHNGSLYVCVNQQSHWHNRQHYAQLRNLTWSQLQSAGNALLAAASLSSHLSAAWLARN